MGYSKQEGNLIMLEQKMSCEGIEFKFKAVANWCSRFLQGELNQNMILKAITRIGLKKNVINLLKKINNTKN